jgi:hypothetical protein
MMRSRVRIVPSIAIPFANSKCPACGVVISIDNPRSGAM